jgi:hypothetical protein
MGTTSSIYVTAGSCTCSDLQFTPAGGRPTTVASLLAPACFQPATGPPRTPQDLPAAYQALQPTQPRAVTIRKPSITKQQQASRQQQPATAAGNSSRACCRPPREGKEGGSQCHTGKKRRRGEEPCARERMRAFLRIMPVCLPIAKRWGKDMGYTLGDVFFSFFLKKHR